MTFFSSWPFPVAVAALAAIAFLRGNATYWLGRAARSGAGRTRVQRMLQRPGYRRAESLVGRWGPPAVALSFLTVGLQTLINLGAGVTRMPLRGYLPAVGVGAVLWGLLYAGLGGLGWSVFVGLYRQHPALAIGFVIVLVAALAFFIVVRIRRDRRHPDGATAVDDASARV